MAIKSIKAEFGANGANGIVFLGGTTALNLLGQVSAGGAVPETWKKKLNDFISCPDGESFSLGGKNIIKNGFYVKASGIQFTQTEHGDKGPAYWELAKNVSGIPKAELAATMRNLLAYPGTSCDPWIATLTAAMFMSEVVRNPRSFMINLMLLDLIQGGVKYGQAGVKELDFNKLLKFDGGNTGKTKTYTYSSGSVTVGKNGESGTVRGGKLPMSQLNAMQQYQDTAEGFEYKKKFDAYAKQSSLNLQQPASAGVGYHFTNALLEKECTVALRWLLAWFGKNPLRLKTGTQQSTVAIAPVWGKPATTQVQTTDVTVAATLSPLGDHVRNVAWIDAETTNPAAVTVTKAVSAAFRERQTKVDALL